MWLSVIVRWRTYGKPPTYLQYHSSAVEYKVPGCREAALASCHHRICQPIPSIYKLYSRHRALSALSFPEIGLRLENKDF